MYISPRVFTIKANESVTATVYDDSGSEYFGRMTASINDSSVADITVDSPYILIDTKKEGSARITVRESSGELIDTIQLTVTEPEPEPISSLTLTSPAAVNVGEEAASITITFEYEELSNFSLDMDAEFLSEGNISYSHGSGTAVVNVEANSGGERSGGVMLKGVAPNGEIYFVDVTITQSAHQVIGTKLYYTSTDGNIITPKADGWGANIVSNVYEGGQGCISFDGYINTIPSGAFNQKSTLKTIEIPSTVTSLGDGAFERCIKLVSIEIPAGVEKIPSRCFFGCNSLTSLVLPDTITVIENSAFQACSLKSVNFTNGLISVGNNAFAYIIALNSVTLPNSVSSIGNYAFEGSNNLNLIYAYPTTAPSVENNTFKNVKSVGTLYYPAGSDYSSWLAALPAGWSAKPMGALPEITVDTTPLSFESGSTTKTLSCQIDYADSSAITSSETWCTASYANNIITVNVTANPNLDDRTAVLTVSATNENGTTTKTISVSQSGRARVLPEITVDKESLDFDYNQSNKTVNCSFTNTESYTFTASDSWIIPAYYEPNHLLTINVRKNEGEPRNGSVTITATNGDGTTTKTISVSQSADTRVYTCEVSDISVPKAGTDGDIQIRFEMSADLQSVRPYIDSLSTSFSPESQDIIVKYTKNTTFAYYNCHLNELTSQKTVFVDCVVKALDADVNLTVSFSIVQEAADGYIVFDADNITIPTEGGTEYIPYHTHSAEITSVQSDSDWVTVGYDNNRISLSADNYGETANRSAVVTVTIKDNVHGNTYTYTINVMQMGVEAKLLFPIWRDTYITIGDDVVLFDSDDNPYIASTLGYDHLYYHVTIGANEYFGRVYRIDGVFEFKINDVVASGIDERLDISLAGLQNNNGYVEGNIYISFDGDVYNKYRGYAAYNDWTYDNHYLKNTSSYIDNVLDKRQIFMFSVVKTLDDDAFELVVDETPSMITANGMYTFIKKDLYDRNFVDVSITDYVRIPRFKVENTCMQYCLYYKNTRGGYQSILLNNASKQTDKITTAQFTDKYNNNNPSSFGRTDYQKTVVREWTLKTQKMSDAQSIMMHDVFTSTEVYLHDLNSGEITPVVITDTQCEHRLHSNNGRKPIQYTVKIQDSRDRYCR